MPAHCLFSDSADFVEIYVGAPRASIQASGGCDQLMRSFARYGGGFWVAGGLSSRPSIACRLTYRADRAFVAGSGPIAAAVCTGMGKAGWSKAALRGVA
jgi:hypothetical protein